jgi:hypothetical protein
MRTHKLAALALALGLGALSSAPNDPVDARTYRRVVIPSGTTLHVRLDSKISTENNQRGDSWNGTVSQSVVSNGQVVIPAGSPVTGVVTSAAQGTHESKPQLGLAVRRVNVNGESRVMNADTPVIVAGSRRAKKIGAIVGGAAAGALLGHVVTKSKKGALIGGVAGGAAGYGLTRHALRTLQLKPGTVVTFTTRGDLVARR